MKRLLTLVGAIATLAAGVTAAVALGAGSSSPDTATGTTTATAPDTSTGTTTATTVPDTATGTTTATTVPDTATGTTTATTVPDTATATTTATTAPATSTGMTPTVAAGANAKASSKVWVCHHTGSWKHPYHLIHISAHALPAHISHGDVTPGADNSCPMTQPAGAMTHNKNEQSNKAKTKHDNPGEGDDKTETNDH